jgi:hypothetical protein
MENKLRKIVVRGQTYQWRYVPYVRHLPHHPSRLLIFSKETHVCIEVFFHTHDTWTGENPLHVGLPVLKHGQREFLSFNQPKFVAALLELIMDNYHEKQLGKLTIDNGNALLLQMGYREENEDSSFRFLK